MKELSKSESLLNEYVMNTSELSSNLEHIFTQQSINNNLYLKMQSKKSTIKNTPFNKFSMNNIVKKNSTFDSNLIKAIECNNINKIKEYLEKNSSNINILNEEGLSPLHIAIINGNLEVIKLLLKYGADPNKKSLNKKQTPLHLAYIFKNIISNQIVNILIKNNANPNIEDINNKRPSEYYLKYKESNDVENTLSYDNEDEEIEISNDIQTNFPIKKNSRNDFNYQDSFNENKNNYTYTISDSEATITEAKTRRYSGYNIEELIKNKYTPGKNNNLKIRTVGKKKGKKIYKKNNYNINNEKKQILNINNNYFLSKRNNLYDDSLEINLDKEIFSNEKYIYDNNSKSNKIENHKNLIRGENHIFATKKLFLNKSHQDLRIKNNISNITPKNNIEFQTENKNKEININEQFYFNNEFYNNFYSDKDLKSKGKRSSFKIPKSCESRPNNGLVTSMSSTHNQTYKKNRLNQNINEVKEFIYSDEFNNLTESENSQILKNWLNCIELPFYFDNFIKNNINNITFLINKAKNKYNIINYEYIENLLKIHKSGHIYRILCKLEVDAGSVENKICNFLVGINNNTIENNSKNNKTVYLQSKECYGKCYNCCDSKKPLMEKRDLMTFLRKYNLLHLYENFYHNGFNLINYVILQMYTKYSINDDIIQKCFHIYKKKDRYLVLDALFNEVKEINIFFSTNIHNHCLFPKYENNDWESSWNDETINTDNENSNKCIIF